jgi:hypothetical protein
MFFWKKKVCGRVNLSFGESKEGRKGRDERREKNG